MTATPEFYRSQAEACAAAAAGAGLDNQRDKYLSAQRAWEELADRTEKIQNDRQARLAATQERIESEASSG